jgi:hypothetical protein
MVRIVPQKEGISQMAASSRSVALAIDAQRIEITLAGVG